MLTIYHNSTCSTSREGLKIAQSLVPNITIINYLEDLFTADKLKKIINLLAIKPIELIRTNESIWKEQYKNIHMSDEALVEVMILNPKLIQRPILIKDGKAIIGRPVEKIREFLQ